MADVFAGGQVHQGSFRADQVSLLIGGISVAGFILQQVQFNFTQQVSMIYEIGSNNVYYVGGRAQGTASVARIIGPAAASSNLFKSFGDICNPQDLGLSISEGCIDASPAPGVNVTLGEKRSYTLQDAILIGVGGSIAAQDILFNEQLQFMFTNLDVT